MINTKYILSQFISNLFFVLAITATGLLSACTSQNESSNTLWQAPVPQFATNSTKADKIAQIALQEHQMWGGAFINKSGQLARYNHYESANSKLLDGSLAWERVIAYWRDSGALSKLNAPIPYHLCNKNDKNTNPTTNICRAFASDTAWSAAFISYVMKQANIDFYSSPRHSDYMYYSWQNKGDYRLTNLTSPVSKGDLLCYLRGNTQFIANYTDLVNYFSAQKEFLPAHCEIVVQVNQPTQEIWLVGGNVLHTVMLRKMTINNQGQIIIPSKSAGYCWYDNESACHFNHQRFIALLKLQ